MHNLPLFSSQIFRFRNIFVTFHLSENILQHHSCYYHCLLFNIIIAIFVLIVTIKIDYYYYFAVVNFSLLRLILVLPRILDQDGKHGHSVGPLNMLLLRSSSTRYDNCSQDPQILCACCLSRDTTCLLTIGH